MESWIVSKTDWNFFMPDSAKIRIARARRRLAIPRQSYLEAVKRQEGRAWAKFTDPRPTQELLKKVRLLREKLSGCAGENGNNYATASHGRDPDPALFDKEEKIRRDEKLISFYLADNPLEQRRPRARGLTHQQLLDYWKGTPEGRGYIERWELEAAASLKKAKAKYLCEQNPVEA